MYFLNGFILIARTKVTRVQVIVQQKILRHVFRRANCTYFRKGGVLTEAGALGGAIRFRKPSLLVYPATLLSPVRSGKGNNFA